MPRKKAATNGNGDGQVHEVTAEEAAQVLRQKDQELIKKCSEEVDGVLKKHNCTLSLSMIVTSQGNVPQVQVVPRRGV